MKTLLTVLSMFVGVVAQAQTTSASIMGTWDLSQFTLGDSLPTTPQERGFKRLKIFSTTHFTVLQLDAQTNEILGSLFGTYSLAKGILTESILNVSKNAANMNGKTFTFKVTLSGTGTMNQVGDINGLMTTEKWTKVK
ncbi:hypothetical protein [Rufibacter latericius]|nr:hypothetical protein [Rufibacter latericius]